MLILCILLITAQTLATEDTSKENITITNLYPVPNSSHHNEPTTPPTNTKKPYTAWNIDTTYTASNITEDRDNISTELKEKEENNSIKEFRPSQHLGSFFDEDVAEVIRKPILGPVKKPVTGFISSPKDEYATYNKLPKQIYQTYTKFPYKYESTIYTKPKGNWHYDDSLESKPTVQIPMQLPAGGLYKSPDFFREHPLRGDFSLAVNEDGREIATKKRGDSWQSLLRLMTAVIPVGLIVSALTPNVITIQETGPNNQSPTNHFRRSDTAAADIAPISERCRRRLLCELHSDTNYTNYATGSVPRRNKKHCYKIHCEDPQALWRTLQWLLAHHRLRSATDELARHMT